MQRLFHGYLHQDWEIDYGSVRECVRAFARENTGTAVEAAAEELRRLLADPDREAVSQAVMERELVFVHPPALGLSYAGFLRTIEGFLSTELASRPAGLDIVVSGPLRFFLTDYLDGQRQLGSAQVWERARAFAKVAQRSDIERIVHQVAELLHAVRTEDGLRAVLLATSSSAVPDAGMTYREFFGTVADIMGDELNGRSE